jgi:ATP-dependent RNA helicase DDX3X
MDSWNTVAGALLEAQAGQGVANSAPEVGETVPVNPQAQGWAQGEALDYERYALTNQQLAEQPEVTWAATASRYEWNDEYGDVGPPFPDLEFELFGDPNRVRVDSTGDSWRK